MNEKEHMNPGIAPPPYPGPEPEAMPVLQSPYQSAPPPGQPPYPTASSIPPPPNYQSIAPTGVYTSGPPPMMAPTRVVIQQNFTYIPAACICPNCGQNVVTRTQFEVGLFTWLLVGIIIICGGWIFCLCFLPFCIDSLKDVRHTCPNCNFTIYLKKRL